MLCSYEFFYYILFFVFKESIFGSLKPSLFRVLKLEMLLTLAFQFLLKQYLGILEFHMLTLVALLYFRTVQFWDLVFLCGAGGSGNPCYRVQACLVNFALQFQKC